VILCLSKIAGATTESSASDEQYLLPKPMIFGLSTEFGNTKTKISNDERQVDTQTKINKLSIPLGRYKAFGYTLVPKISLGKHEFTFDDLSISNTQLYTLQLPVLGVKKINDNWVSIWQISPGMQSDEHSYKDDIYTALGFVAWRYRKTEKSSYRFGLGVNRLFGENRLIPLLSYNIRLSPRENLTLGLPITQYQYGVSNDLSFRVFLQPDGNAWRYKTQAQTYTQSIRVKYESLKVGLGFSYHLTSKIFLSVDWARRFEQNYEFTSPSNASLKLSQMDMSTLGISLGLHP